MKINADFFRGRWKIIRIIENELSSPCPFTQIILGDALFADESVFEHNNLSVTTLSYSEQMFSPETKLRSEQKYHYFFCNEQLFIHFPKDHHHSVRQHESILSSDDLFLNPLAQFDLSSLADNKNLGSPSHICSKDLYTYQLALSITNKHEKLIHHVSKEMSVTPSTVIEWLEILAKKSSKKQTIPLPAFFILEIQVSGTNKNYCIYNFLLQDRH